MRTARHVPADQGVLPYHRVLAATFESMVPDGGSVLDVGCGNGALLGLIAGRRPDLRLAGIDGDPLMVELAAESTGADVDVVDLDDLDAATVGRFDAVVCCHVLEHLTRPLDVLVAMRSSLTDRGRAVLAVPNLVSPIPIINAAARREAANEGHLYGWDRPHFQQLLRAAGLDVERWVTDSVQVVPGRNRENVPDWVDRFQVALGRAMPYLCESLISVTRPQPESA
ncbi:MAG: class I SAM-dependent methyltransferase [Ilumatobacter sp.]|uniref:class I SAM-dependent methyltransferase n=1 Tax=Ilumatobacter sp. TaxID=1967498 RepID=UPI002638E5E2|nr:class I SAM-dependent methyltransferase [Ilumatobacter sp.]MDJ0771450.1 class I SAM-dependent methyltransferase [Ilumatobacter sp.]